MRFFLFAFFILFACSVNAQEVSEEIIENFIEEVTASTDQELDYTTIYEDLVYFLNNPLNLNEAELNELEKLYILSEYQMKSIIHHRETYGQFYTLFELIHLGGFNADIVRLIQPFVTVEKVEPFLKFKPSQVFKYGSNQVFIRSQKTLEEAKGYSEISPEELEAKPNSRYPGSPLKLYTRYKFNYKNYISWGITAEKDPGEEFFKGNRKDGFDYYSAHFFARKLGPVKSLALGDFNAQFGQGLVMFNGFGYGKSSMVLDIRKRAQGLRPYGGTDENLFFRGAGATVGYKSVDLTVFFSHKTKDANVTVMDSLEGSLEEVSSLQTSGLHRTPAEIADRKALTETVYGANVKYNHKKFRLGATGTTYSYDASLLKAAQPYNQYVFSGKTNANMGVDYQVTIRDLTLFGEAAMSQNGGMAFLNGALFSLSPAMNMALLHRHYQRDYQAFFASGFGENSSISNESGMYFGTIVYPFPRLKVSGYYDLYTFPWLKYGVNAPSRGFDYIVQGDYSLSRYVNCYLRFKHEVKPENVPSSDTIPYVIKGIEDVDNTRLRFHIAYRVNRKLEFRNRVEWVKYSNIAKSDKGFLLYHDVIYKPERIPFAFSARYAIFDTDSWDSRLYAYESDVLYSFSIPAYYDRGSRVYFNVKYSISKRADFWFRISQTYYRNMTSTGSGLDEIQGKTKTEVKVQLRFKF
jgi:hypothetical protein